MKRRLFYFIHFVVLLKFANAQENKTRRVYNNMLWGGYYNTLEFNSKWSLVSDIQIRTNNWQESLSQGVFRVGLNYKFNERVNVTTGFAYFNYFSNNSYLRNEYRPWQEVAVNDYFKKIKITHRYRIEERFNQIIKNNLAINDYLFNYRIRYKLDLKYPIKKETEAVSNVYFITGNELMVNFGRNVNLNFFDQNRVYAGIQLELSKKFAIQFQYVKILQQLSDGFTLSNTNVFRFNIYHKINL